jgi:hypothetical protein
MLVRKHAAAETCADDNVFAVGMNAKKVARQALGDIFSLDRASKIEIPVLESRCERKPSLSRKLPPGPIRDHSP